MSLYDPHGSSFIPGAFVHKLFEEEPGSLEPASLGFKPAGHFPPKIALGSSLHWAPSTPSSTVQEKGVLQPWELTG